MKKESKKQRLTWCGYYTRTTKTRKEKLRQIERKEKNKFKQGNYEDY